MQEARNTALDSVEQRTGYLSDAHQTIWHLAEPVWREYRSAVWYLDPLRDAGFDVDVQTAGMLTASRASFGSGAPVIATSVEYDAVPGNSQTAVPCETPRPGTLVSARSAAQQAMRRYRLAGTLVVFGEPAEKTQGSKPVHAAKGCYDPLSAAVSFHPAYMPPFTNDAVGRARGRGIAGVHVPVRTPRAVGADGSTPRVLRRRSREPTRRPRLPARATPPASCTRFPDNSASTSCRRPAGGP